MDASVVGDLLARERRSPDTALHDATRDRTRSYRDVCTTAYKAGNFLRYLGVDGGDTVGIAADPRPQPLVTFLGGALLGAVTRFAATAEMTAEAAALLVPASHEKPAAASLSPGMKLAVYGDAPARPETVHWEETVWSENPAFPPTPVNPTDPVLATAESIHSHGSVLGAARRVVDEWGLGAGDGVALRASLEDPRAVTAGVVAPLLAGGYVVLPPTDGTATGAALAVGDGPEATLSLDSVSL